MSKYITAIEIIGLHGQFDFACEFQQGINVIYGRNGSGKTTLLHILANVVNGDYLRFAALNFSSITVSFSHGDPILVELEKIPVSSHYHGYIKVNGVKLNKEEFCPKNLDRFFNESPRRAFIEHDSFDKLRQLSIFDEKVSNQLPQIGLSAAYFPAFRTAIDAWAINADDVSLPKEIRRKFFQPKTLFARSLFGQFVPSLDYPATSEIEENLNRQIRDAIANVSKADRTYFGDVPSKILKALANQEVTDEDVESILGDIEDLSARFQEYPIQVESMWATLSESVKSVPDEQNNIDITKKILNSYKDALMEIVKVQENSFSTVEKYLSSVNAFLEGKNMEVNSVTLNGNGARSPMRNSPSVVIKYENSNLSPMSMSKALSSGERQIATLIYSATRLNEQEVILIDEPEISLNVDWQRKLLPEMQMQMPSKQLIVCTHSPIVGAKYRKSMIQLNLTTTKNPEIAQSDFEDDFQSYSDPN